ncbi:unnamed protein product [Oikopleura dioica]|uniref:CAAX prenyl protease 2 n=1 Tax=Oikopleura dioica TaxID=34765 RepID=E4WXJ0_OIKDI|nr:unnamed protein product [Oikopleura dioica]
MTSGFASGFEFGIAEHFEASWKTLLLMILLYIGPIYNCISYSGFPETQSTALEIKTIICAPIIEEILFRSIIISRFSPHYSQSATTLFALTLFSLPHLHHLLHEIPAHGYKSALSTAVFRTVYTAIFGGLSCFLFFKFGTLFSPILAHSWCNYFGSAFVPTGRSKTEIFIFCIGLFSFAVAVYINFV